MSLPNKIHLLLLPMMCGKRSLISLAEHVAVMAKVWRTAAPYPKPISAFHGITLNEYVIEPISRSVIIMLCNAPWQQTLSTNRAAAFRSCLFFFTPLHSSIKHICVPAIARIDALRAHDVCDVRPTPISITTAIKAIRIIQ